MKDFMFKLMPAAMVLSLAVASCDILNGGEETPVFPEAVTEFIEPGGTVTINFTANMDWTASIPEDDADVTKYFAISDGGFEVYSVSGYAGEASITIVCLAEEVDFENHSVELSLTMGDQTQVIATVTLPSLVAECSVYTADVKDGAYVNSGTSDEFSPSFTGEALAEGSSVSMLWDGISGTYQAYLKIVTNFRYTVSGTASESLTLNSTVSDGNLIYSISSDKANVSGEDLTYTFILTSDNDETYEYTIVVPAIEPSLSVRPVLIDEYGYVYSTGGDFIYSYNQTALSAGDIVTLVWPDGTNGYAYRLLVISNMAFEITSCPEWLIMDARTTVGNNVEYFLNVSAADYSSEAQTGTLGFTIANPDEGGADFVYEYTVALPAVSGVIESSFGEELKFNENGWLYQDMAGEYYEMDAMGRITAAKDIQFFFVSEMNGGLWGLGSSDIQFDEATGTYAVDYGEMTFVYPWDNTVEDYVQTVSTTVSMKEVPSTSASYLLPRSYYIFAIPSSVVEANQITGATALYADNAIIADYEQYIITKVTQAVEGSGSGSGSEGDFLSNAIDSGYLSLGYALFEKLESEQDIIDASSNYGLGESIYESAQYLYSGAEVYLLIYTNSSMSEGPGCVAVNGNYHQAICTPSADDGGWLQTESWESNMYISMGATGAAEHGSVGTVMFVGSDWSYKAVLYCVRLYE